MFNNYTYINKTNYHLSSQIIEHEKIMTYDFGYPVLGKANISKHNMESITDLDKWTRKSYVWYINHDILDWNTSLFGKLIHAWMIGSVNCMTPDHRTVTHFRMSLDVRVSLNKAY